MGVDLGGPANAAIKAIGKPRFIYGTAWKKARTGPLLKEALLAGFTAVDTAAQPRHYREDLVGEALRDAYKSNIAKRESLYIQTKFTSPAGQDLNNMPYDASKPLEEQIHASVASSLRNLRPLDDVESEKETYIDCLVMHSPLRTSELTVQAWKILESYVPSKIKSLGISNVSLPMLATIWTASSIKPAVVQNRFYPQTGFDNDLRRFCRENSIQYQSFWTLTGNPQLSVVGPVIDLAEKAEVSKEVALYALVMSQGVTVLNGTTSKGRMAEDLESILRVNEWAQNNASTWEAQRKSFMAFLGEEVD